MSTKKEMAEGLLAGAKAPRERDEFQIMRQIGKLLDQLPTEAKARVTGWLIERLGEKRPTKPIEGMF